MFGGAVVCTYRQPAISFALGYRAAFPVRRTVSQMDVRYSECRKAESGRGRVKTCESAGRSRTCEAASSQFRVAYD
jgi:hypothetical protein